MKAPPKVLYFCSPSGGHLNPAVTFSLCFLGREPWRKFPLFFFFQTLGAFLGAAVVFGMFIGAWDRSERITLKTRVLQLKPDGCTRPVYAKKVIRTFFPPDALWDLSHGKLIVVGTNATAGIFATYPSKHLSLVNGFFDQVTVTPY